jgi:uncharacterized protein (DUF305 family)
MDDASRGINRERRPAMKKMRFVGRGILMLGVMCLVFGAGVLYAEAEDSSKNPATTEYQKANMKMHHGMDIEFTGNADLDFVRGMIPHHQGAIDMATIQLKYGHDEEMKELSRSIIEAQKEEIKIMQEWLKEHE